MIKVTAIDVKYRDASGAIADPSIAALLRETLAKTKPVTKELSGATVDVNQHSSAVGPSTVGDVRLLLVVALLTVGGSAFADRRAAVVALDVGTELPSYLRGKALVQIEQALAAAGDTVLPSVEVAPKLGDLATCRSGPCIPQIGTLLGAELLVIVSITKTDENSNVVLRIHDGGTGEVLAELTQLCELCGEAELLERFNIAVSTVRAKAGAALVKPMEVVPPIEPPRRVTQHVRGSRIPGISVAAGGVVLTTLGIVALAINGKGTCSPGDTPVFPDPDAVIRFPDPDDPTRYECREVYQTKTPGLIATGVGVVAIAAGVALVIRANRGQLVEVAPTPGGVSAKVTLRW